MSSLTYEWEGRLRTGSAGDTTVDLLYDPEGNRVFRQVTAGDPNSTPTVTQRKYIVDAESDLPVILLEIDPDASDPNASVVKTYLYTHAQILAQHDGHYAASIYFYLHDRLGSVRQVIDTDGAVANTYTYEPFGAPPPAALLLRPGQTQRGKHPPERGVICGRMHLIGDAPSYQDKTANKQHQKRQQGRV